MTNIRHPEYRRELENTKYPFIPSASLSNETVSFLEGTFLDAHIYSSSDNFRVFISQVNITSTSVTLILSNDELEEIARGTFSVPVELSAIQLLDPFQKPAGILISEPSRLGLISAWGIGEYEFEPGATEFCVTCCMPVPQPGLRGLRLENGDILSGKIWIIGDDGVVVNTETKTNKAGELVEVMKLNVVGDPLYLQKLCDPENLFTPVNAVREIAVTQDGEELHNCEPDEHGNFNIQMNDGLVADPALRIRTTPDGILLQVEGSTNTGL